MEDPSSPPKDQRTCPSCGSPVEQGHKFCEICGTKMEDPLTCRKCGAKFPEPVKFCESCGTPVTPERKTHVVVTKQPDPEPSSPVQQTVARTTAAIQSPSPGTPDNAAGNNLPPQPPSAKTPLNKMLIAGGVVVLLVVIAVVYFVGLPLINGSSGVSAAQAPVAPSGTQTKAPTIVHTSMTTTVRTPVPTTPANFLVPLPTQDPPKSQDVFFQVQKDQVDAGITVLFAGGPGSSSINNADVRVTHPDGKVVTGIIQPSKGVTEITLDGSKETDRVEVIVMMYNGQTYRVIDELLTYKER